MNDAVLPRPRARVPWLNGALFVATVGTTVVIGGLRVLGVENPTLRDLLRAVPAGVPFSAPLIAILLAHEMGHYVLARRWGVDTTLPFFIPVPFGIGTFGAVIRMRSRLPSRKAVLDVGAAGPLAGFLVALPLFAWGIAHSTLSVEAVPHLASNVQAPFDLVRALLHGEPLHGAGDGRVQFLGDSLVTWGIGRLVLGPGSQSALIHPVALAAWFGLLVTTLNMIPIGQLDGGHVVYALLGQRRGRLVSRVMLAGLLLAGFFWSWSWLVWFFIAGFLVKTRHPPALDEAPLDGRRKLVAWLSLAVFALTFIPVPISV